MAKSLVQTGTLERWAYISYFSRCLPGQEEGAYKYLEQVIARTVPDFQLAAGNSPAIAPAKIQTASQ